MHLEKASFLRGFRQDFWRSPRWENTLHWEIIFGDHPASDRPAKILPRLNQGAHIQSARDQNALTAIAGA